MKKGKRKIKKLLHKKIRAVLKLNMRSPVLQWVHVNQVVLEHPVVVSRETKEVQIGYI